MNIPEGHFTITAVIPAEDCDHGLCRGLHLAELGLVVWLYDNDPTRISFDAMPAKEEVL